MKKDVKKNDKTKRNALGGTYAVVQKEKHDCSTIQDIRQYVQAKHYKKNCSISNTRCM